MKKILPVLLVMALSFPVFAGEFSVSGEVKSGLLYEKSDDPIRPINGQDKIKEEVRLGSKDDAGSGAGRVRINMEYITEANIGFKIRLNWENWGQTSPKAPDFPYAFGFGNFFKDQLTMSIGILGSSPWGTGGPEMWKELEVSNTGGMRFEYKPSFVPGELNVGFVLNWVNGGMDSGFTNVPITLGELLKESVLGVSYTHEYFLVRFAYRLDSKLDVRPGSQSGGVEINQGDDLIYRVEERIIKNYLPGFQIWALGSLEGVGIDVDESCVRYVNWLFAEYAPDLFTAQIRFGFDVISNLNIFHLRPNFYWNFFDKLIVVGAAFQYAVFVGSVVDEYKDSPFYFIEVEPKLQINFSPQAYAAFVYNFRRKYVPKSYDHIQKNIVPAVQEQWINLRFGLTF